MLGSHLGLWSLSVGLYENGDYGILRPRTNPSQHITKPSQHRTKPKLPVRPTYIYWKKSTFPPSIYAKVRFSSLNSKTGQITSLNFLNRAFYLPDPVISGFEAVLSFSFLFISVESLKNHSKSQNNHKIENPILLNSTWVDLHTEHIIWYTLVQSLCCRFWSILLCN
jgi:hypothetical protein